MKEINCLNHRLEGVNDFMDLKSKKSKNLCHLSNLRKSVMQTTNADILNSILELI